MGAFALAGRSRYGGALGVRCGMEDKTAEGPASLLPYDDWTEEALRLVVVRAIAHVAAHGLPGDHHFYLTFRTDYPGTVVPPRLRAEYPQEMTIVLQNQFWNLRVDEAAEVIGVGLSFGGVPAELAIPLAAVTGFADPHVRFGLRFRHVEPVAAVPVAAPVEAEKPSEPEKPAPAAPQVVSLDAFRRRPAPKD